MLLLLYNRTNPPDGQESRAGRVRYCRRRRPGAGPTITTVIIVAPRHVIVFLTRAESSKFKKYILKKNPPKNMSYFLLFLVRKTPGEVASDCVQRADALGRRDRDLFLAPLRGGGERGTTTRVPKFTTTATVRVRAIFRHFHIIGPDSPYYLTVLCNFLRFTSHTHARTYAVIIYPNNVSRSCLSHGSSGFRV